MALPPVEERCYRRPSTCGWGQSRIAYQVIGEGPRDLVVTNGSLTHVDIMWDDPVIALMFRRFSSFSRLIRFDRLGTGASDPAPLDHLPPWESYAEELAAVLDEVGSERTAILVSNDAASMALYFAGAHPQRTSALILFNSAAKYIATEDYPIGMPREAAEAFLDQLDQLWGTEALTRLLIPSRADDERFCRWHAKLLRSTASPKAAQAFLRVMFEIDARPLLPLIHAPTLVLHRTGASLLPIEYGRYLAEHIADAKLSSCQAPTSRFPGTQTSHRTTLRSSWVPYGGLLRPPGCWRPCCLLTSSGPPNRPAGWAIGAGVSCWRCTTSWPGE